MKKLAMIVPVYNDPINLEIFANQIPNYMNKLNVDWEVVFVIDPDDSHETENKAKLLNSINPKFNFVIMARRFGQAIAIQCGLQETDADVYIIMDVDGQDPLYLIPEMIKFWFEGFKIVLPKRLSRKGENLIRILVTNIGYLILNKYSKINIPKYVGDFRLIDKKIRNILLEIDDPYYFLRGNVSQIGFPYKILNFHREKRSLGKTNYPKFFGSLSNAVNAIFGYTNVANKVVLHIFNLSILIVFSVIIILLFSEFVNILQFLLFLIFVLILFLIFISSILFIYILRIHDYLFKRPRFQVLNTSKNKND